MPTFSCHTWALPPAPSGAHAALTLVESAHRVQEMIYAISGEGVQTVGDGPAFPIRDGDALYVPKNTLHSTYNTTRRPLRLVVVYTPGGTETGLAMCAVRAPQEAAAPSRQRSVGRNPSTSSALRVDTSPAWPANSARASTPGR